MLIPLICNVCGGKMEVDPDRHIGVCKYCDSAFVIPQNLGHKENLYNRAIFLRRHCEFDRAVSAYEDILREDNSDAEAHWGLVLSKYGIEYVRDPNTQKYFPTCHRTQGESILSDPDYLEAIDKAKPEAKKVIKEEAERINTIQSRILEISQKEPAYDIFICYKESDESGNRTEDSIIAQDIYYELCKKGYKVFFARKTLESRIGAEYEPIIYAALKSAKVMMVVGTRAEHFNAVWVHNEWSRFLKIGRNTEKAIIPAYKNMSPYELPAELASLQSQDMSKIGFLQDLIDGIERYMHSKREKAQELREMSANAEGISSLKRLLQNGDTYLKLDNYAAADEVYTTITRNYPEDYHGWWGKIICQTQDFTKIQIDTRQLNTWFGYIRKLAPEKEYAELEEKYAEYMAKVAKAIAGEDIKAINSKIATLEMQIVFLKKKISDVDDQKKAEETEYKKTVADCEREIGYSQSEIAQIKSRRTFSRNIIFISAAMIVLGCLIGEIAQPSSRDDIENIIMFMFVGGFIMVLMGVFSYLPARRDLKKAAYERTEAIASEERKKENCKKKHEKKMEEYEAMINQQEKKIRTAQESIAICKQYVDLGQEALTAYWYAIKCSEFGVKQPFNDSRVPEYRQKALEIPEKIAA